MEIVFDTEIDQNVSHVLEFELNLENIILLFILFV